MSFEVESSKDYKVVELISAQDNKQFSDLLDLCFSLKKGRRFFDDFPIWDSTFKIENRMRFGIYLGDQLICSCAVRKGILKHLNQLESPICLIGAVATHPSWRGKGLATLLVNRAVIWGEEQGALLAFLWGSEHALYQRLGFELCGEQMRIPLNQINFAEKESSGEIFRGWTPELFQLICERSEGLKLSSKDRNWFEAHKNVEWYYLKKGDQIQAYAALGRGIDLQGMVHEWGGEKRSLLRLLEGVYQSHPRAEILGPPEGFMERLKTANTFAVREYLCMAKVLKLEEFFQLHYPDVEVIYRPSRGQWEMSSRHLNHRTLGTLSLSQMAKQCFGPERPIEQLKELPLTSLWIWGLDAV